MYTCDSTIKFGDNQADCEADLTALCIAAVEVSPDKDGCGAGLTYNGGKASECIAATKAQSCADFNSGKDIAACDEVCK